MHFLLRAVAAFAVVSVCHCANARVSRAEFVRLVPQKSGVDVTNLPTPVKAVFSDDFGNVCAQPTWEEMPNVKNGETDVRWEGMDMSDDGSILVAVSMKRDTHSGLLRIFTRSNDDVWAPIAEFNGSVVQGEFGSSVSISGNGRVIAVGAPSTDNLKRTVEIYKFDNKWDYSYTIDFQRDNNRIFGRSVSLSFDGTVLASGDDEINNGGFGIYREIDDFEWVLALTEEGDPGDQMGASISVSRDGLTVAVGIPYSNGNNGSYEVYRHNSNNDGFLDPIRVDSGPDEAVSSFGDSIDLVCTDDQETCFVAVSSFRQDGVIQVDRIVFNDDNEGDQHISSKRISSGVGTENGIRISDDRTLIVTGRQKAYQLQDNTYEEIATFGVGERRVAMSVSGDYIAIASTGSSPFTIRVFKEKCGLL